jgi:hypothetical protein
MVLDLEAEKHAEEDKLTDIQEVNLRQIVASAYSALFVSTRDLVNS